MKREINRKNKGRNDMKVEHETTHNFYLTPKYRR